MGKLNLQNILDRQTLFLIASFLFVYRVFGYQPLQNIGIYSRILTYLPCLLFICVFYYAIKHIGFKTKILSYVGLLQLMIFATLFWSLLIWGQFPFSTFIALEHVAYISVFFVLKYYNIKNSSIINAIIILGSIYIILHQYSLFTFPNSPFGTITDSSGFDASEYAERSIRERGLIRLNLPGAEFVIFTIFVIITYFRNNKKYYWLLIPFVYDLFTRGTRTPIASCIIVAFGFYIWTNKNKLKTTIIMLLVVLGGYITFNYLEKHQDNAGIIGSLFQLTEAQIEANKYEDDIRIRMAKYYITEFNSKPIQYIVGNGIPGNNSDYGEITKKMSSTQGFWLQDSGLVMIFIYYGFLGIILYLALLLCVLRINVSKKSVFAKLYVIYCFLLLPTNCLMIYDAPLYFGVALYLIYRDGVDKKKMIINRKALTC